MPTPPRPPRAAGSGPSPESGSRAHRPLGRTWSRIDLVVVAALAAATALAWLWLIGAPAADHEAGMPGMAGAGAAAWSAGYLLPAFTMWALMMVAMMLPSAAPVILLHARVARQNESGTAEAAVSALSYLAVWTIFSAAAALLQALLVSLGLVSALALAVGSRTLAALLLAAAALYQISRLKQACLDQCRSPLSFVMRLWRPGAAGAFRLGVAHGLYCLGCCWVLMLLLFVGGVMNLAWVALLAGIVFVEKLAPRFWRADRILAAILALAASLLLVLPALRDGLW